MAVCRRSAENEFEEFGLNAALTVWLNSCSCAPGRVPLDKDEGVVKAHVSFAVFFLPRGCQRG
jgi:hypothetical protein